VMAAVLMTLLVGSVVAVPYVKWRRRSREAALARDRARSS